MDLTLYQNTMNGVIEQTTDSIETYLLSLPEDVTEINVGNRNLEYLPSLARFKKLDRLLCANNRLKSLPEFNESLTFINCDHNQLMYLPEFNRHRNLTFINCSYNQLTYLPEFNKCLSTIICGNNKLTYLPEFNFLLKVVSCSNNQLTYLPEFNVHLRRMCCNDNLLTSLPRFNERLTSINCDNNKLTYLPKFHAKLDFILCEKNLLTSLPRLNKKLGMIGFTGNPVCEIVKDRETDILSKKMKKEIEILNNFHHLYYSLKYKTRFRDWLWVKVREPKIIQKYHPNNLIKMLDEGRELEEILLNW